MKIVWMLLAVLVLFCPAPAMCADPQQPENFVDVSSVAPTIVMDIRYYTPHNFLGVPVDGYECARCLLTRPAAEALARVQQDLEPYGYSLKIYDCYRPQRAVNHFVRWAKAIDDTKTKGEFYPTLDKRNLFRDGFIASRSGHSRGSTVDLTIVPVPTPAQETYTPGQPLQPCFQPVDQRFKDDTIDMGTGFDCFHELSHTANPDVGPRQRLNRLLLKTLMEKHGFVNYSKEWWHYSFRDEPYPKTFFDFPIKCVPGAK
ncbi:MAG: M15 family metallopeptidase [Proteobacteria bacterium]|nr:M15 family metallopeptidase [Pseudomonadota bacterium]